MPPLGPPPPFSDIEATRKHVALLERNRDLVSNKGNVAFVIPEESKEDLEAIYFFGMPYKYSVMMMQINLLPYLSTGAYLWVHIHLRTGHLKERQNR